MRRLAAVLLAGALLIPGTPALAAGPVAWADAITPNDPGFSGQWGLVKTGVTNAWSSVNGSGVTVAVVDTGVRNLPDFTGRLLPGRDFVNKDNNAYDDEGHGTMAAGVIGAAAGNHLGIAGTCFQCRILPVKVLGKLGSGSYQDISDGIRWAADQDADIISLSLGGTEDEPVLRDAVAYAVGRGSLVIAAAGNKGKTIKHYPAAYPDVLAVGGSTGGDARYPWSNYGSWVDLAAPGCNPAQTVTGVIAQYCGTSSATPFTAGVAALLASATPKPSAATIRTALMSSAIPLAGKWVAAGSGRIDADAALAALPFRVTGLRAGSYIGSSVKITPLVGRGSGITRVVAAVNGVTAATTTAAPWTLTLDTSQLSGPATITVTAYAGATKRGVATYPVVADNIKPTVAFAAPAAFALIRGAVNVTATASDDVAVSRVELLGGSTVLATDTAAPYVLRWQSAPNNRALTLTLRAYDRAGNVTTSARTFTADNTGPAVIIKAPGNNTRHIRLTQYVAVKATDPHGIGHLDLVINGKITQTYAGGVHTFAVQTWKHGSVMTVQVRAYDKVGNLRAAPARKWYR